MYVHLLMYVLNLQRNVQVSFGMEEEDTLFKTPAKSVAFNNPQKLANDTSNSFLSKIGSILTRPPTPPVSSLLCFILPYNVSTLKIY